MRLVTVATLVASAGCWLDFDQFQPRPTVFDATLDHRDGTEDDLPSTSADAGLDVIDAPAPDDRAKDAAPSCQPGRWSETQLRVAHMAPGVGPLDLCIQKRGPTATVSMMPIQSARWPAGGLDYGQVSQSVPLNSRVMASNEVWDIAVVERGVPCNLVPSESPPLAIRSIQLDPELLRLIVVTAEPAIDGHLVPFINLVDDENCTDCLGDTVDVRGIHAALGVAAQRLTFTVLPQDPWSPAAPVLPMRTFATGVSYGGDQGYACNQVWGSALHPAGLATFPARFEVTTTAGRLVARSEPVTLEPGALAGSRTVTVFFEGSSDDVGATELVSPGFILCYDGISAGLLSHCQRVAATAPSPDATLDGGADGAGADADHDADAVAPAQPPDASVR